MFLLMKDRKTIKIFDVLKEKVINEIVLENDIRIFKIVHDKFIIFLFKKTIDVFSFNLDLPSFSYNKDLLQSLSYKGTFNSNEPEIKGNHVFN